MDPENVMSTQSGEPSGSLQAGAPVRDWNRKQGPTVITGFSGSVKQNKLGLNLVHQNVFLGTSISDSIPLVYVCVCLCLLRLVSSFFLSCATGFPDDFDLKDLS